MRVPTFNTTRANGIHIGYYQWPGAGDPVVFSHATGFHSRCWDEVIRQMDVNAIAVDMRSHGRSQQVAPPMHWRDFGHDIAGLGDALGWRDAVGVGHSMGGHAVLLAAALRPGMFRALLLLDPVIMPSASYTGVWVKEHFARKRRRNWDSPREMYERFCTRPPFQSWDRQVLRDYCDYALNGNELACPPEVEGSIYENCTLPESDLHAEFSKVDTPVIVVRSKIQFEPGVTTMEASMTDPQLANLLRLGGDAHWRDVSHFIPMEVPERVAGLIEEIR